LINFIIHRKLTKSSIWVNPPWTLPHNRWHFYQNISVTTVRYNGTNDNKYNQLMVI